MKLINAMYAWTRPDSDKPTAGMVKVGLHPDWTGWSDAYSSWLGAGNHNFSELSDAGRLTQMFLDFHKIVVGDRVNPQVAHKAFLEIDEYRRAIAPDIEGAEPDEY
jgi:hypothetical protein